MLPRLNGRRCAVHDGPDGSFRLPAAWCESTDAYYRAFLEGRVGARIVCRFVLADGTVIDGPCKVDKEGRIVQVRPNVTPRRGFGLT